MTVTSASSLVLPAVPASAAEARRNVSAQVGDAKNAETVALLVSELVNVAMIEGDLSPKDTITLHIDPVPDGVRVTVCDSGMETAAAAHDHAAVEVTRHGTGGGLGLKIVARLARRWGVTSDHPGARAWFEMDVR